MRIGLFVPCYIDALFPEVRIATHELLERFGQGQLLGGTIGSKIPAHPNVDACHQSESMP
jgi:hypothetical protein